ncbi:hypothetical protein RIF29_09201 [Crotalaria pallida]|uniref:Protein FAR1-RELATED SEQUENCE n=1 Tax=Crotalaria pallida TaxID=3830 RepID=A0AAN9FXV1_CROPI
MKDNCPQLVITNGDNSMKNAINFVFPQAHHRLCSWNLVLLNPKKTASSTIYTVKEYLKPSLNWTVTFYPEDMKLRCSCFHMESFGIPCVHIIKVLMFLDILELPKSLVLNRWTKNAKEVVQEPAVACGSDNDVKGKRKRVTCGSSQVAKKHGEQIGSSTVGGIAVASRSKGCGQ